MLTTILNLILINVIVVIITDLTDWPDTMKKLLSRIVTKGKIVTSNYRFHLLDCSLCLVTWLSLLYILITGLFSIVLVALCLLSALFTPEVYTIILLLKDIINTVIALINKLIKLIN